MHGVGQCFHRGVHRLHGQDHPYADRNQGPSEAVQSPEEPGDHGGDRTQDHDTEIAATGGEGHSPAGEDEAPHERRDMLHVLKNTSTAGHNGAVSDLVLATFNIRNSRGMDGRNLWPLRRRATLRTIRALDADVVCLQEVRRGQLVWLRRRLRGHAWIAVGRDDGRRRGEHMVLAVRRGVAETLGHQARWFTDTPLEPSRHPEAQFNRFALGVRLLVGERAVTIVTTHLDEKSAAARADALERLAAWYPRDTVIAGDFNCTIDDPALGVLLGRGWTDSLSHLPAGGPGVATHHYFTGTTDETRIDHILAAPGVEVSEGRIVHERPRGRLASDHWPVVCRVLGG